MRTTLTADDETLVARFGSLRTARDVAALLEVAYSSLTYHLYRRPMGCGYTTFTISKKTGGTRTICAPVSAIKILQRKLNRVLQLVYGPKRCVHGFCPGKSILTNARAHVRRTTVLNIDLQDFFPSINFGRVRGMFMARPYRVPEAAATVLAQLCCFNGSLPQGAPTSPVVSNMVCGKLDSDLLRLAHRFRCTYTRYADDMSFSTTRRRLPTVIGRVIEGDESVIAEAGELLRSTIESNGFQINAGKVRIQSRGQCQEVTGLVVNSSANVKRAYVRRLRAVIHAIQRYGLKAAERELHIHYYRKSVREGRQPPSLGEILEGRFAYLKMVKGETDPVYRRLFNRYQESLGQPRVYVADPLRDVPPALWVLESEDPLSIGSAFAVKEIGLVTCSHVLTPATHAFRHDDPNRKFKVQVISKNDDLDVAILELPPGDHASLELGDPRTIQQGDRLILVGFPNYRFGDTPYIVEGRVASFRTVCTMRWMLIDTPIVAGNSGGPVLAMDGRVIGIAATGVDRIENAHETEHHGVIPIAVLEHLR